MVGPTRRPRYTPSTLAAVSLLACPAVARAQTDEELVARRVVLTRAEAAAQAGQHEEAVALATRAGQIQMRPSLRLFLIREHRALSQVAAALGHAEACVREVGRDSTVPMREQVLVQCRAELEALQPLVATVTVRLADGAEVPPGFALRVNRIAVPQVMLGLPRVVDPGAVLVEATATGQQPFEWTGAVPAGADRPVQIAFRPAERAQASAPGLVREAERPARGVGPFVLMGVGGAALVAGGVFYGLRLGSMAGCAVQDDTGYCNSTVALDRARTQAPLFNALSITSVVAGGAAAAGGLLWLLLAPQRRETAAPRATAFWTATPTYVGVGLRL